MLADLDNHREYLVIPSPTVEATLAGFELPQVHCQQLDYTVFYHGRTPKPILLAYKWLRMVVGSSEKLELLAGGIICQQGFRGSEVPFLLP